MNRNNLAYNYARLQEWNDDPFDLGDVKELTRVNYQQTVTDYAEELVANYAAYSSDQYELHLNVLPDCEKNELARLYIESTNREVNECVYGDDFSINSDYTCAILALLKHDCKDTRDNLTAVITKNILIYYKEQLQQIIDDACDSYIKNAHNEEGYYAEQDLDGDVSWSKA